MIVQQTPATRVAALHRQSVLFMQPILRPMRPTLTHPRCVLWLVRPVTVFGRHGGACSSRQHGARQQARHGLACFDSCGNLGGTDLQPRRCVTARAMIFCSTPSFGANCFCISFFVSPMQKKPLLFFHNRTGIKMAPRHRPHPCRGRHQSNDGRSVVCLSSRAPLFSPFGSPPCWL